MSTLSGKPVANTYKDLLTIFDGDENEGIESTLKTVRDGEGVATALQLSTTHLKIPTGKTLEIAGTLSCVDATLTGDLAVGDDLTVTDLISGASMVLTGSMTSDSATIGGGYSGGGSGTTITSAGNIQTNGLLLVGGTSTLTGQVDVGGGYSGGSGLTISTSGEITTTNNITCSQIRTTTGEIKSSSANSPKIKLDDNTKVQLTVRKSNADAEVLTVEKTGTATFKDEDGDTKFTVKDDGRLKLKTLTTSQRNALSSPAVGEMVADDSGNIHIYM